MRANHAFPLGLGEDVHHPAIALGPVGFREAVHQADVEMIGAEFAAEAVKVGFGGAWVPRPRFSQDRDLVAGDMLQSLGYMWMGAVSIGGVEEAQTMIVAVEQEVGKAFHSQRALVGAMSKADGASAHGEATGLNAGVADGHRVSGAEFSGQSRGCQDVRIQGRSQPGDAHSIDRARKELSPVHNASCRGRNLLHNWTKLGAAQLSGYAGFCPLYNRVDSLERTVSPVDLQLNDVEIRVLGSLVEKDITTPDYYPLSLNALVNACNQKNNRDPVMNLDEAAVRDALSSLQEKRLAGRAGGADSRVTKYEHRMQEVFNFTRPEIALIGVLLLRGPQTPGELRGRAERMHRFEALDDVQSTLQRLMQREPPLVKMLARQPGTKEARYAHLFAGDVEGFELPAAPAVAAPHDSDRVARLEEEVGELRRELNEVKDQLERFRRQFE
jgi:uncharacterized protein YceH (UPF0502 family)